MAAKNNPPGPSALISLFPLPATVFYPGTLLPLHIFEPRYRQMMSDALEGDRRIGMVLLKPGWEANYHGAPAIAGVGCAGEIGDHIRFDDGKYNMILKGRSRFRIIQETAGKPYRQARVELLAELNDQDLEPGSNPLQEELTRHYTQYISLLPSGIKREKELDWASFKKLSQVTDQLAFNLDLPVEQKQKFLEEQDVLRRVDYLQSEIKMKIDLVRFSKTRTSRGFDVSLN